MYTKNAQEYMLHALIAHVEGIYIYGRYIYIYIWKVYIQCVYIYIYEFSMFPLKNQPNPLKPSP